MSIEAFYERFMAKLDKSIETSVNSVLNASRVGDSNRSVYMAGSVDGLRDAAMLANEVRKTFLEPHDQEKEPDDHGQSLY